jgi:Bardet-Biedl syndrome 2 protein
MTPKVSLRLQFSHQANSKVLSFSIFRPAKFLNTNKEIIAMATGKLDSLSNNEMLFIGSRTNLLAYDVENNKDLFDKEVSDGVNCLAFGTLSTVGEPLIVAGGNCSITGFDIAADERFWTVTGDNASSIQFMDWDEDGEDELVVGSDDFSIRVFKNEEMIFDIQEQSKI